MILDLSCLGKLYRVNNSDKSIMKTPYFVAAFMKDNIIWGLGVHDIEIYKYGVFDEFQSHSQTYIDRNMTYIERVENLTLYNNKLFYDDKNEIAEGILVCTRMIFARYVIKCIGFKSAESGIEEDGHHYLKTDKIPAQMIPRLNYWTCDMDKERFILRSVYNIRDNKEYDDLSYIELYKYMIHILLRKYEDLILLYNMIYHE